MNKTKREIKFNAWIPILGIMLKDIAVYNDGMIGIVADEFEKAINAKNKNWKVCDDGIYLADEDHFDLIMSLLTGDDWYWIEEDYNIKLQFTGLKDKNGKEIYEGDTVKHPICEIGTVIFFQPYAQFTVEKGEFLYDITYHDDCEKIGNIYENESLIK
jgi:hypothetical protein